MDSFWLQFQLFFLFFLPLSFLDKWFDGSHDLVAAASGVLDDGSPCERRVKAFLERCHDSKTGSNSNATSRYEEEENKMFFFFFRELWEGRKFGGCRAWLCLCVLFLPVVALQLCVRKRKRGNDKREEKRQRRRHSGRRALISIVNWRQRSLLLSHRWPMATEKSNHRPIT